MSYSSWFSYICKISKLELNVVSEDMRIGRAKIYKQCVPILLSSKES